MRLSLLATTFLAAPALLAGCTRGDTTAPATSAATAEQTETVSQAAVGPVTPADAPKAQLGT